MVSVRGELLMIAMLGACTPDATASTPQAIVGGIPSAPSAFPATGMLVVRDGLMCTATLIAPDVALTAAHCLRPPTFVGFGFTLDTDETDGTAEVVPVTIYHRHPGFDPSAEKFLDLGIRNDIGIVLLARPVVDVVPEQIDRPATGAATGTAASSRCAATAGSS